MLDTLFPKLAADPNVDNTKIEVRTVQLNDALQVTAVNYGKSVFIPMKEELRGDLPDPAQVLEFVKQRNHPEQTKAKPPKKAKTTKPDDE